jgi:hypothetical protein
MIDPLTSNGFTFALRFGAHAAELIAATLERSKLPPSRRRIYDSCQQRIAHAFNAHIHTTLHGARLRQPLGLHRATWVYVVFGFFANAFYQRLRPRSRPAELVLRVGLALFDAWIETWALIARKRRSTRLRAGVPRGQVAPNAMPSALDVDAAPALRVGDERRPAAVPTDVRPVDLAR